jgi:iron complex outermembrane receptor protein
MTNRAIHARRRAATPQATHSTNLRPTPLALALHLALMGGTLMASGWSTVAHAQGADTVSSPAEAAPKRYDIPAGPLGTVLARFAGASGVLLAGASDLVQGRNSPGLSGTYTTEAAIKALLTGTGLEAVRQANGSYALRQAAEPTPARPPRPAVEAVLPVVTVKAGAELETATAPVAGYVAKRSTSGSKTDTPTREIPQSISVVTRDSMDGRGVSSLAEALEYAPGFTSMTYGQDDRNDWSIARGIGSTLNGNFRDGLKERGSTYYAIPRLNTYGVERIEYLRGPASVLYGSSIPGGVVNSITKRPTPDARGEVRVRGGDLDRLGLAADVSGPLNEAGTVLYRLVALDEKYDLPTPRTDKEERYFAPALTFRLSPDTEATLLANYQQDLINGDAYPYSYWEPWGRYVPALEKGWDRYHRDQWSTGLLLDHRFSENLSVHSRTRYSKVKLDYRLSYANDFLSETLVERRAQYFKDDARVWQTDNYVESKWQIGNWANTTIVGADISTAKGAQYYGDDITSPYDLTTNSGVGEFVEPELARDLVSNVRQTGIYVQNQAKIDDRFVILAGLRNDRYRQDTSGASGGDSVRHNKLTGRLGGVWLLPSGLSPYVSYSTSFQPQTGATYDGSPFKPTEGRQYEIGVRYEPKGVNAQFTIALFDLMQRNVLTADPEHRNFSIQQGEVGSRGLEFETNASLARGLDLTASYSYTDARVTKDTNASVVGRKNAFVPRHKLAAWVDWRVPASILEGLSLGVGVRYNSEVPNHDNTRWVPSVTLVDARLGYRLDRHWEFAVNARNLLNKSYLVSCAYGTCYPGDRREVIGTATYRW